MAKEIPQRQHLRANLPGNVLGSVGLTDEVRVVNLSPGGAMIQHAEWLALGRTLLLGLQLGHLDLRLPARVVWSQRSSGQPDPAPAATFPLRSGLQFVEVPREAELDIQDYLATLIRPRRGSKPPSTG